jgi:hypothetical protein
MNRSTLLIRSVREPARQGCSHRRSNRSWTCSVDAEKSSLLAPFRLGSGSVAGGREALLARAGHN